MPSHTPGPWTVLHAKSGRFHIAAQDDGPTRLFLVAETALDSEVERANARLIAAAPDMLAALRDVAEYLGMKGVGKGQLAKEVRAAIAKATGE